MAGGHSALAAAAGTTTPAAAVGCAATRGEAMRRRLKRRVARLRAAVAVVAFAAAMCIAASDAHAGAYSVWAHCYDNHSFTPSNGPTGELVAATDCDGHGIAAGMRMNAA